MSDRHYDVAIVGFGPVGQVAANLLGQLGHRVAVFETATSIYNLPRAAHFDGEIMRVFQSIGLAEAVLPATCEVKGMDMVTATGERLFGFQSDGGVTASGWPAGYMIYQPDVEDALQAGVERFPNVEVFAGHEVTDVRQTDDAVGSTCDRSTVAPRSQSARRTSSAATALAASRESSRDSISRTCSSISRGSSSTPCSSGRSTCRRSPNRSASRRARRRSSRPLATTAAGSSCSCPATRPMTCSTTSRIWELLRPWVGPDDTDIIRAAVYSFHAVIAREWQRGRIFIAGDAAHQMPPFLGQGMCAGIRDVANLAWKFDLVLRGVASESILATYQPERAPHVRTIIERAVQLGNIIQATDPEAAKRRDQMFLSAGSPSLTPRNDDGPMSIRPPGISNGLVGQCIDRRFGQMFPQGRVRLSDG